MFALPVYIDRELWDGFWEMRKKMGQRAPITDFGKKLILKELMKFYAEGYDPNSSLENSIMKGWRGVFPGELRSTPKTESDPAIKKIQEDAKKAAPMPAEVRAKIAEIANRMRV